MGGPLMHEKSGGIKSMTTSTDKATMVPMEVKYVPAWLTWVGCTATCMNALGKNYDIVDVAGTTGYAFIMSVHKGLCPSGPTVFDWNLLLQGIVTLGFSPKVYMGGECYDKSSKTDRQETQAIELYKFVGNEITAGRPVVIWGTYVPEFGVATGVDDQKYHVKSFRECLNQEQPPIPYDELAAPGGFYGLAFPTESGFENNRFSDLLIITNAVRILKDEAIHKFYGYGLNAYDTWMKLLEAGPDSPDWGEATGFGNAYNAQCWNEAKWCAAEFLKRLAGRNDFASDPLMKAADEYGKTHSATKRIAELFPFSPGPDFGKEILEEERRKEAVGLLKDAQSHETEALKLLIVARDLDWQEGMT